MGLVAACAASGAIAAPACVPVVEQGWIRAAPPGAHVYAGYARIREPCGKAVVIVGARSGSFAHVQMHETRVVDGVGTMRETPRVTLAARGTLAFAPGGNHLMLMQPARPLPVGSRARIAFTLADGRVLAGDFVVRRDAP